MRGWWSVFAAVAMVGALAPAVAQGAYTPQSLYDCKPRDPKAAKPPPQPDLPPSVEAALATARASEDFKPLCPQGEVPYPTQRPASPKAGIPRSRSDRGAQASRVRARVRWQGRGPRRHHSGRHRRHRSRVGRNGKFAHVGAAAREQAAPPYWYSWSIGEQGISGSKGVNGLWVLQTNEQPYVDYTYGAGAHSIGQLWAINEPGPGCFSTAETGWSESYGQFGDVNPHLFIAAFDCGHFIGYAGSGAPWVQSSGVAFPNQVVSHNDVFHVYGARMDGNNWWFYYDGQWVGYIPHGAWVYFYPYVIKRMEAGGEVATIEYSTCSDMGYAGLYGGNPGAAMFGQVWYEYNYNTQAALTNLYSHSSDPSYYATGNWAYPPNHGYAFRYGGPGWC